MAEDQSTSKWKRKSEKKDGDGLGTHSGKLTQTSQNKRSPGTHKERHFKKRSTKNTWRRELEAVTRRMGYTGKQLQKITQDRGCWKTSVGGPMLQVGLQANVSKLRKKHRAGPQY